MLRGVQNLAQMNHVDYRALLLRQLREGERVLICAESTGKQQNTPPVTAIEKAEGRGQGTDCPHRHAPPAVSRQPDTHPDKGLRGFGNKLRKRLNNVSPHPALLFKQIHIGIFEIGRHTLKPFGFSGYELVVKRLFCRKNFQHGKGQGTVPSRQNFDMLVGTPGGIVFIRINNHQPRTIGPRLRQITPEMNIAHPDIDSPGNDQLRPTGDRGRRPPSRSAHHLPGTVGRRRADRLLGVQGTHPIEERKAGKTIHFPHIPGVVERQHAVPAVLIEQPLHPGNDILPGLTPANPLKPPLSFFPCPDLRIEQPLIRIKPLGIAPHFPADKSVGIRMLGISVNGLHPSVPDGCQHAAAVGTIEWADCLFDDFHKWACGELVVDQFQGLR